MRMAYVTHVYPQKENMVCLNQLIGRLEKENFKKILDKAKLISEIIIIVLFQ